jgi:hypothetical protein
MAPIYHSGPAGAIQIGGNVARLNSPTAIAVPGNIRRISETALGAELAKRLGGATRAPGTEGFSDRVVWTDRGDDVLVHLSSIRTRMLDRMAYVSVDLETDQTGRTPLVCAFALGNPDDLAGLVAVTDELPRGNGLLASRWGELLQFAIWNALLGIVSDFAKQINLSPAGLAAVSGELILRADS